MSNIMLDFLERGLYRVSSFFEEATIPMDRANRADLFFGFFTYFPEVCLTRS
jgi:hypothetical protein